MFNRVLLSLFFLSAFNHTFAQGLEGVIVERYYMSDANDAADAANNGAVVPLTAGSTTFRVFIDMAPNYEFSQIFGNAAHNLLVSSTADFYNDPSYGIIINPGTISASNIRKRTAMIDSWFTTGGASNGKVGVLKVEDTDGTVGNQHNLLQNNAGGCYGVPINGSGAQDGLTPNSSSTYIVPNALGLGNALDVLDQTAGNNIVISNGAIAALGGIVGPTSTNRVLIAQFTTIGVLSFSLNVQLVNTITGAVENYVASSPGAGELTHPTLSYNSNTAPTISLLSPQNGTTIGYGNYTISASANDNLGSVSTVEFFVDGASIGSDNTAPYEIVYNATVGNHAIYAVASDSDCLTAQSSTANVTVSSNQAPNISLTAPSTAVEGSLLTFTASASDPDGSITQVEFYVDGILIGSDNTAPFTANWAAVLGIDQVITAEATDNTGLSTVSNVVLLSVNPNIFPTVSVTYPFSTTDITAPEMVSLTANANDVDGSIVSVAFYVNGELVGTATSEPYVVNWLSMPGPTEIYAVATDSNGAQTTSNSVNLVVLDPSTQPYAVGSITQSCEVPTFCAPILVSPAFQISNVIGFDITLTYNPSDLVPSGNSSLNTDLIPNSQYASINLNTSIAGQVQVSVTLNGNAPAGTSFNGYGVLGCIEFNRLSGLGTNDSTLVGISNLIESYVSGPVSVLANSANMYSVGNTSIHGIVSYLESNTALNVDEAFEVNDTYTEVFGVDASIITNPNSPAVCDADGTFIHDLNFGTSLIIHREITNSQSIQSVVNGADARIGKLLLDNQLTPTLGQILALDVNLDGFVTAGDISQMNQRAALMIEEYQQAWNYDNQGNSNGQPSKDWIFVDGSRLSTPAFQLSSTYPADDQIGFSVSRVPTVPFIVPSLAVDFVQNSPICQDWSTENYRAILLGDADGSYATSSINTSDTLVFDLSQATFTTVGASDYIEVPVVSSFNSSDLQSFDIATKFNLNKLSFVEATTSNSNVELLSYFNSNDDVLRVVASTNGNAQLDNAVVLVKLKFEVLSDCSAITSQDFNSIETWLNGNSSEHKFIDGATLPNPIQVLTAAPFCAGSPIDFSYGDQIEGLNITSYEWTFGDGTLANGQTVSVPFSSPGEITIQLNLTAVNGCNYQIPGTLFVSTSPQPSFTYSIGADGQTVNFTNASTIGAGSISSYSWDFGDTQVSNEVDPVHTYATSGSYTITLSAVSALGCSADFSQLINTVGIQEETAFGLNLYPVPAQDYLFIGYNAPIQFEIVDMQGRVVLTHGAILSSSPSIVDMRSLTSGMYILVANSSGRIQSMQFVKE